MDTIGNRLSRFFSFASPAFLIFIRIRFTQCMKYPSWLAFIVLLGMAAMTQGCASVSLDYSTISFDKSALGPKPPRFVTADLIDARKYNTADLINKDHLSKDLAQLRGAVREQLVEDGLASSRKTVHPAPKSVADVESVLSSAAIEGADAVLFLRMDHAMYYGWVNPFVNLFYSCSAACAPLVVVGIVPLCIVGSLPLNEERASAVIEAVVIEPKTKTLLGRFKEEQCYSNSATLWTHNPPGELPDIIGGAVQKALTTAITAAKDGFPARGEKVDLQTIVNPSDLIIPKCGLEKEQKKTAQAQ